ncbi:MAG: hypothetical protein H0X37_26760 [Herpetosiphonaceae bacterium]|nr:hypothetical protein [Herpetosiphonaceae bacterium]
MSGEHTLGELLYDELLGARISAAECLLKEKSRLRSALPVTEQRELLQLLRRMHDTIKLLAAAETNLERVHRELR